MAPGMIYNTHYLFVLESMTSATSPIILKWDPKSLEIRTLTVERLLEPLVTQVSWECRCIIVSLLMFFLTFVFLTRVYIPVVFSSLRREQWGLSNKDFNGTLHSVYFSNFIQHSGFLKRIKLCFRSNRSTFEIIFVCGGWIWLVKFFLW